MAVTATMITVPVLISPCRQISSAKCPQYRCTMPPLLAVLLQQTWLALTEGTSNGGFFCF